MVARGGLFFFSCWMGHAVRAGRMRVRDFGRVPAALLGAPASFAHHWPGVQGRVARGEWTGKLCVWCVRPRKGTFWLTVCCAARRGDEEAQGSQVVDQG